MADDTTLRTPDIKPQNERQQQRRPETNETGREPWIATAPENESTGAERSARGSAEQALRAGGEGMRRTGEALAEATRRGGEIGSDNVREAAAASENTLSRGSEALAEGQRHLAEETARHIEEIGRRVSDAVQASTEDVRLTWGGSPSSANAYAIAIFLPVADPRLEPISTCGNDGRIYSHSVGRHVARTTIPHSRGHRAQGGWDPSVWTGVLQPRGRTIATRLDLADLSDD